MIYLKGVEEALPLGQTRPGRAGSEILPTAPSVKGASIGCASYAGASKGVTFPLKELKVSAARKTKKEAKREEFERVALVHLDLLYNTALRMTGNVQDAEDLVQETFLRAYRFFDKFKKGTNCKAWLFKIMKNNFINRFRKKAREPSTVSFDQIEAAQGVEPQLPPQVSAETELRPDLDELVEDDVKYALESLPLEFKMAVILSDISGLSYKEIAEIMGTPIGTVRSRLSRARGVLQRKLYDLAVSKGIVRAKKNGLQRSS